MCYNIIMYNTAVQKKGFYFMIHYIYTPESFSYRDPVENIITHAANNTREYYCRIGAMRSLPQFIRLLNYISMCYGSAIYLYSEETITRSTNLNYLFDKYTRTSEPDDVYRNSFYFKTEELDAMGLDDVCALHLIPVTGQITETFETQIPAWAQSSGATELLNVSLALKLAPKHRVRVYQRKGHVFVFTTRGLRDCYDTDYDFHRKLWATIPYIQGWQDKKPELTNLYKLLVNEDATAFWTALENTYHNTPEVKDIKYKTIIDSFKNISKVQLNSIVRARDAQQQLAEDALIRYANALKEQQKFERRILEYNAKSVDLPVDLIKLLYDKKIAYNLDTRHLDHTEQPRLSYRCSAPCTNYDKDAATVYYKNQVLPHFDNATCNLYKLIFISEKVIINFDEEIIIDFRNFTTQAREGSLLHGNDYHRVFPNPHHSKFNCWGSYGTSITKLISQFKLEDLFYQIKAAVGSLNFVDYAVMGRFMSHLASIVEGNFDPQCFLWRDENCNTLHTFQETLEHFKEDL